MMLLEYGHTHHLHAFCTMRQHIAELSANLIAACCAIELVNMEDEYREVDGGIG